MAVATAPVEYERQAEPEHIVTPTNPTSRWGAPIWAADEPIAALDRPPVAKVDVMMLTLMLSYRSE